MLFSLEFLLESTTPEDTRGLLTGVYPMGTYPRGPWSRIRKAYQRAQLARKPMHDKQASRPMKPKDSTWRPRRIPLEICAVYLVTGPDRDPRPRLLYKGREDPRDQGDLSTYLNTYAPNPSEIASRNPCTLSIKKETTSST